MSLLFWVPPPTPRIFGGRDLLFAIGWPPFKLDAWRFCNIGKTV